MCPCYEAQSMLAPTLLDSFGFLLSAAAGGDAAAVTSGGGGIAIEDDGGTWTYAMLRARAERIARSLLASCGEAGLTGERVALFVAPGGDFVASFYGVLA